jgi:glycerol-3-phosphate O-acyltransferase
LEYHFFNHLFLEKGLPLSGYCNALTLRRWMRWRDLKRTIIAQEHEIDRYGRPLDPAYHGLVEKMVIDGQSLFLEIPPSSLEDEGLSHTLPIQSLMALIQAQKKSERPISIVPLDFLWSRRPERPKRSVVDILFGEKESPGSIRKTVLFWRNYKRRAQATFGRPIDLTKFIQEGEGLPDQTLAKRLRSSLSVSLAAQRRTITGPPIRPHSWFIHEVMSDENLDAKTCRLAAKMGKGADELRELATRYVSEIAADVDYTYIELFDRLLGWTFRKLYDSFDVDTKGLGQAKELYEKGPIAFVPNHKSHVDYLLLSYILYNHGMTVPLIAAGENLNFWPLGKIFRHGGAYFIRRTFKDNPLYKAVLETYLKILLKEGYSQVFFIEGGRSRTGKLRHPRVGMVSMLRKAALEAGIRQMSFIPVSITYDRTIEQKSYVRELEGGEKKRETAGALLKLMKYIRRPRRPYGSIYVRFDEPVYALPPTTEGEKSVKRLALNICHRINRRAVATPIAVAACALLSDARRGLTVEDFRRRANVIASYLSSTGAELSWRLKSSPEDSMEDALSTLADGKMVARRPNALEPYIVVDEDKRVPLSIFKNSVVHFMITIGVVSLALQKRAGKGETPQVSELVSALEMARGLLAHEFLFEGVERKAEKEVLEALNFLKDVEAIRMAKDRVELLPEGRWTISLFASQIQPFLETLLVALDFAAERMEPGMEEKALIPQIQNRGQALFLLERIHYREAVTRDGLRDSLKVLTSHNIIRSERATKDRIIYHPTGDPKAPINLQEALERFL